METANRKFTSLSFLALSSIVGYVFYLILTQIADLARFGGSNVFGTGLAWPMVGGSISGVVGLGLFIGLMTNKTSAEFTDDVFAETKKTTWPTFKETSASTVVVSIMVLIASLMFLFMDIIWGAVFKYII